MNFEKYDKNFWSNNVTDLQSELEIQAFLANSEAIFSEDFLEFTRQGKYKSIYFNDFYINNGITVHSSVIFHKLWPNGSLHESGFYSDGLDSYEARIDDFDKFLIFASTIELQPLIIGIKEPFKDQVYLLNSDEDFKDEPIRIDPDGIKVYPKHFLANSFVEFIDLLYEHRIKDEDEQ